MILPDEIVTIISKYAKPLPRIHKSKFWVDNPVPNYEMISIVVSKFELYIGTISRYFRVEHLYTGKYWSIKAWIDGNTFLHCILRFTLEDVVKWNGRTFECRSGQVSKTIWSLTEDSMYTFGVHGHKLVKLIKINRPEVRDKELFC